MLALDTLQEIKQRFDDLNQQLVDPEALRQPARLAALGRELAELRPIVAAIEMYERLLRERAELDALWDSGDDELVALAEAERESLDVRLPVVEAELEQALIPKDPADARDAIVEIRAGTGGDEAALFAGDLYRMYERYAQRLGWRMEVMDFQPGGMGGYKEVIFALKGQGVYGQMKFESGVHRVQRVPATESQGRIHTSAATVAVLPEAEEVDVQIHQADLRIDTFCSSGPGGQSVNTTYSAVRITHIPTGLVVSIQDEKSQIKNKEKALRVLRSRLYQQERERIESERAEKRKEMVGSGDRSAKIRTYNWPQARVTDHRLEGDDKNYPLQSIVDGDLERVVKALRLAENAEKLAGAAS